MKNTIIFLCLFICFTFCGACNEGPATGTSTADSGSVKKMSADSNSDMPIHAPKDSMEKMPNALDSAKKLYSR